MILQDYPAKFPLLSEVCMNSCLQCHTLRGFVREQVRQIEGRVAMLIGKRTAII